MQQQSRVFLEILSQMLKNTQLLSSYRLSPQEIHCIFDQLNSRRKGYIDLADIYGLLSDSSEDQLFAIFKALDRSRNGRVQKVDLQAVAGALERESKGDHGNWEILEFDGAAVQRKFQDFLLVLRQNCESLERRKRQVRISKETVTQVFKTIKFYGKDQQSLSASENSKLEIETLIKFLTLEWGFSRSLITELDGLFPSLSITQEEFSSAFLPVSNLQPIHSKGHFGFQSQNVSPQERGINGNYLGSQQTGKYREVQFYLNRKQDYEMSQDLEVYKQKINRNKFQNSRPLSSKPIRNANTPPEFSQFLISRNLRSYEDELQRKYEKGSFNNLHEKLLVKGNDRRFQEQRVLHFKNEEYRNDRNDRKSVKDLSPRKQLNEVEKRREQLKKGSLQRKRLMDEVLNRKKDHLEYGKIPKESDFLQRQVGYLQKPSSQISLKHSHSGYLKADRSEISQTQYRGYLDCVRDRRLAEDRFQVQRNDSAPLNFYRNQPKDYRNQREMRAPFSQMKVESVYHSQAQGCVDDKYYQQIQRILNRKSQERSAIGVYGLKEGSFLERKPMMASYQNSIVDIGEKFQKTYQNHHSHQHNHSSLQKENILKRAEEEATRKIQEIQRKARMKVIEKKSSAGYRWVK